MELGKGVGGTECKIKDNVRDTNDKIDKLVH